MKDKLWIKVVLILAFAISLFFVFRGAHRAMQDEPALKVNVTAPPAPKFTDIPDLPQNATPEQIKLHLEQKQQAVNIYKMAVENYVQQVGAYAKQGDAQIVAAKANNADRSGRLNAYETVVKDTLGPLIVAPLLAALVIYSGIKVGGDVAMAKVTNAAAQNRVDAP